MSAQQAIYEARALKAQKEAQRAQVKLEECMGPYEESEGEEEQPRKRLKTMGLRKELEKQNEEELALAEHSSLTELLGMEI